MAHKITASPSQYETVHASPAVVPTPQALFKDDGACDDVLQQDAVRQHWILTKSRPQMRRRAILQVDFKEFLPYLRLCIQKTLRRDPPDVRTLRGHARSSVALPRARTSYIPISALTRKV